ncbi:sulfite exporter TauE/SafE family protein [candidate division KSB1 bacterium]
MAPAQFLILIAVGTASGLVAGLLGIGGAIVTTPVCMYVYPGLGIHQDILFKIIFGTNLFMISFASLVSSFRYNVRGLVLWRSVFPIAAFSIIGAVIGALLAVHAADVFLKRLFGVFLLFVAVRMYVEYRQSGSRKPVFNIFALGLTGISTAVVSVALGIGGGLLTIPVMIYLLHYPVRKAPGTSSSIMIFTSLAGMAGYIIGGWNNPLIPEQAFGYVYLPAGIPLMLGAVIGSPVGTWLNEQVSTKGLSRLFGVALAGMSIKMIFF